MMRTLTFTLALGLAASGCSQQAPIAPTTPASENLRLSSLNGGRLSAASPHGGSGSGPRFVEGNAVVTSIVDDTKCPTLSFVAEGFTITATETTRYSSGVCADIIPGRPLTIQGILEDDNSVTASHIVLKGNHPTYVEGDTAVTSVDGATTCPTLSFVAEGHTVKTIETTAYTGGTCDDLAAGVRIQVKGLLLPDDSVTTTSIRFKHENE